MAAGGGAARRRHALARGRDRDGDTPCAAEGRRGGALIARAGAAAGAAEAGGQPAGGATGEEEDKRAALKSTLLLGGLFALWYAFNIYFNIYNKQVLKVTATPFLNTALQFGVGVVFASLMWLTRLHKAPKVTKAQLMAIVPLALVHTVGNLLTNVSLGKVAVSFTHTIKALEPFFSVMLSSVFLGAPVTAPVVLSLLPIVGGVALASATEASFNWMGFGAAMGSNLTFQSRNVLSKKVMTGDMKKGLDNINLFSIITIMSFCVMTPIALAVEGLKLSPANLSAMGLDPAVILYKALAAGLFFHAYQQISFMILERVNPVTHSVGNCVKRVVVIASSIVFFQTPVSTLNIVGTVIALSGVFLYARVKSAKPKAA